MSNEIPVDDFVGDFDDDLVELTTIEDVFVSIGRDKKRFKSKGGLQLFGNFFITFLVRVITS
jgi:hypothetical protein